MNVYVRGNCPPPGARGVEVEIFTRPARAPAEIRSSWRPASWCGTSGRAYGSLSKGAPPPAVGVFRRAVVGGRRPAGWFDVIHSHYCFLAWSARARSRWGVPLVHSAHTLGKVEERAPWSGEALSRRYGSSVSSGSWRGRSADPATEREAHELIELYDADPPGVGGAAGRRPGRLHARRSARRALRWAGPPITWCSSTSADPAAQGPDLLIKAAAELPELAGG